MPHLSGLLLPTACVLVAALALYGVAPWLYLRLLRRRLGARCRQHRAIAVTFDDGPSRELTSLISDHLAAAHVPATFFVLSANLPGHEDIVATLLRQGHEIGSHGERHIHHLWSTPWRSVRDTQQGLRRLQKVSGRDAAVFRPPFGKLNLLSLLFLWGQRVPIVMWTHDGFDAREHLDKAPSELAAELRRAGGGVLLLHDFDRQHAGARQSVLAKLDAVLDLRNEGFRFVLAGELMRRLQPRGSDPDPPR